MEGDDKSTTFFVVAGGTVVLAPDRGRCMGRVVGGKTGFLIQMPVSCAQ